MEFVIEAGAEIELSARTIVAIIADLGDRALEAVRAEDGDDLHGLMLLARAMKSDGVRFVRKKLAVVK